MKTYNCLSSFLLIFTLTITASAQNYPVLKSERIYTPWDTVTTLYHDLNDDIVNLTQDGQLVMLASPYPEHNLRFYFYDDIQKSWTAKYIDSNKLIIRSRIGNYSVGLKRIKCTSYQGIVNDTNYIGMKWIFNYGDSVFVDTGFIPYDANSMEFASPSVSYYSTKTFSTPRVIGEEPGEPEVKPYSSMLMKRNYIEGMDTSITLLSLKGGFKRYPENVQNYENDISFRVINDETVLTAIHIHYYIAQTSSTMWRDSTSEYNVLTTNGGKSWQRSTYNPNLPWKNIDNQWFIRVDTMTYLYSSPRHGIIPQKPVDMTYINKHVKNVEIFGEYANGENGYYCLCNNTKDTSEKDKFLIYSINPQGELQKFSIPNSVFEYKSATGNDTSFEDKQIIYADDTIMYVQVTTLKGEKKNLLVKSQPQIYKIYLKETVSNISEQPAYPTILQPYPNPTDQTLRWNTPTGAAVITDALGRTLIEVPASAMEADVSGLAVGMYFLTIHNGMERAVRSFVVAR